MCQRVGAETERSQHGEEAHNLNKTSFPAYRLPRHKAAALYVIHNVDRPTLLCDYGKTLQHHTAPNIEQRDNYNNKKTKHHEKNLCVYNIIN